MDPAIATTATTATAQNVTSASKFRLSFSLPLCVLRTGDGRADQTSIFPIRREIITPSLNSATGLGYALDVGATRRAALIAN
mgnify:CR=1 FL=1